MTTPAVGVVGVVLHCSRGVSFSSPTAALAVVRMRSLGVEGLLKKPNLTQLLGLGLELGFSTGGVTFLSPPASVSLGMEVQKALLHPVPIFSRSPLPRHSPREDQSWLVRQQHKVGVAQEEDKEGLLKATTKQKGRVGAKRGKKERKKKYRSGLACLG